MFHFVFMNVQYHIRNINQLMLVFLPAVIPTGLLAYVCPCYVFGTNAEHVGGNCVTCAVVSLIPVVNYFAAVHVRGRIRVQKGITVCK